MGRNILFVTTDQQRFDALGCAGNTFARTPNADRLAREGILYRHAFTNNVLCMPARSTMFTGLHPRTHGVVSNGYALPDDGRGITHWLKRSAGYRTALIGKAHFEPAVDVRQRFRQNRMSSEGSYGPWFGFDHVELSFHGPAGASHYARWLQEKHPEHVRGFAPILIGVPGGDTGAPETANNPIPKELYHSAWVAERTIAWLDSLAAADDFFLWVSFPDPHHPWDPPIEAVRHKRDDIPLPDGHPRTRERAIEILGNKPQHWLDWYLGRFANPEGGPASFVPSELTHDQLREIIAKIHAENELVDEALGAILAHLEARGLLDSTDVIYTTDHGELQGDYGLLFKGPYHVDSLMRLPLIWRRAGQSGGITIDTPVSLVDLVPTLCEIADVPVPPHAQGVTLPTSAADSREGVVVTWDSQFRDVGMHIESLVDERWVASAYRRTDGSGGGHWPFIEWLMGSKGAIPRYDGTEGELYDRRNDPLMQRNLWNDPDHRRVRSQLLDQLDAKLPPSREPPIKPDGPS
jgi:arylsulfatase A-like enzyme